LGWGLSCQASPSGIAPAAAGSQGHFCLSCLIGGAIDNDIFDLFLNFSSLREPGDKVPTSCQILMYSSAIAVEFFEAIAHFPGNIIGNFPNSAISLQGTTRHSEEYRCYQSHPHRQEEFRNDFFAVVTDKDLIAEQQICPWVTSTSGFSFGKYRIEG